jgi:hypothetical protein
LEEERQLAKEREDLLRLDVEAKQKKIAKLMSELSGAKQQVFEKEQSIESKEEVKLQL